MITAQVVKISMENVPATSSPSIAYEALNICETTLHYTSCYFVTYVLPLDKNLLKLFVIDMGSFWYGIRIVIFNTFLGLF